MEQPFLGVPDTDAVIFSAFVAFAFFTAFVGVVTGAAGGLMMMVTLASVFPISAAIPIHTVVQLGGNLSRIYFLRQFIIRSTLLPFFIGAAIGAATGAQIFISLPTALLQGFLGAFVIVLTWMPAFTRLGAQRGRFSLLGFLAAFLGIFVSATGTLIAPFVAGEAPDRRNYVATFTTLMVIVHSLKLIAFGLLGVALAKYLPLMLSMVAAATLANWIGAKVLHRMHEGHFRLLFKLVVTGLSLRLIWLAAQDFGIF
jgi:uncharacterized membrane protein YfcA